MILKGSEEEKLLYAIIYEDIKKVKSILKRSNKNKKILDLNEKNEDGYYPLSEAIFNNNVEIVKLLIEYANQHQIILNLNEKDNVGNYPLLEAIDNNNVEIVKLLINYALKHQIILIYNKNYYHLKNNIKIKNLLQYYEKEIENIKKVIKNELYKCINKYYINKLYILYE